MIALMTAFALTTTSIFAGVDFKDQICVLDVKGTIVANQTLDLTQAIEQAQLAVAEGKISAEHTKAAAKTLKDSETLKDSGIQILEIQLDKFSEFSDKFPFTSKFVRELRKNKNNLKTVVLQNQESFNNMEITLDTTQGEIPFTGQLRFEVVGDQIIPSLIVNKIDVAGMTIEIDSKVKSDDKSILAFVGGIAIGGVIVVAFVAHFVAKALDGMFNSK